jgi:chitinase
MVRVLFVLAVCAALFSQSASAQETEYRVVGYYNYYNLYTDYLVTEIPASLLTHLNYTYIDVSEAGQCVSTDTWADTEFPYPGDSPSERIRGNFKQLALLKQANPNLQILMTVGGWEHSAYFSNIALTPESRVRFAQSCVAFMQEYHFDGIDIDWRYPVQGGAEGNITRPEDTANFTLLLEALRTEIEEASAQDERRYLLTIVAPAVEAFYRQIDLERVHQYVDWINLTTFGFEGNWSTVTGHIAPLYSSARDPRGDVGHSVDAAVNAYLDRGVPANKIVVGIPFFAQAWRNVRPNNLFGLYQTNGGVPEGSRAGGTLYYRDLGRFLESSDYVRFFDDVAIAPWMYNRDRGIAISYENQQSLRSKAAYVRSLGLGGVMVWEISYDSENHELLNAAFSTLRLP